MRRILILLALLCAAPAAVVHSADCSVVDGIEPVCGLQAPEDIVALPESPYLLFGEMVADGSLAALDTRDLSVIRLYRGGGEAAPELWGDASCQQPPATVQPHGLDLRRRDDGRWQLFVVNHAEREAVELFEVIAANAGPPQLRWRGCVVGATGASFNDVAGFRDGSFLVTHMFDGRRQTLEVLLILLGFDRGEVYRWRPDTGLVAVPHTAGEMPNGITLAPDEQSFYLNLYFGDTVRRHAVADGAVLGEVAVDKPDNSAWTDSGQLLVASHRAGVADILSSIEGSTSEPSDLPFALVVIDPQTLQARTVLQREGAPMGAATVAQQHGEWLYLGSYLGDRLVRLPLPEGL